MLTNIYIQNLFSVISLNQNFSPRILIKKFKNNAHAIKQKISMVLKI